MVPDMAFYDRADAIVEMRRITKIFGTIAANDNIDLTLRKGEVHAILGENGAGKSTLMNILYGHYRADSGDIFLRGEKTEITSPAMAISNGIGMVHQHFMLVQPFTVTENVILGREPSGHCALDMKKAHAEVESLSEKYGLRVNPRARIRDMSVSMQQKVEILKALYRNADVLILDEPTAVLSPGEIDALTEVITRLAAEGKAVALITHKLREAKKSADVCTVIRQGRHVVTLPVSGASADELAEKMVGRRVMFSPARRDEVTGPEVLQIENLSVADDRGTAKVNDLCLQVRRGEIFTIIGVDGNGQRELAEAITGLRQSTYGKILLNAVDITNRGPRGSMENGVAFIPEDRQGRGLVLDLSIAENLILRKYYGAPFAKRGILDERTIAAFAGEAMEKFDIKADGVGTRAASLSGGNQQKIILARELSGDPALVVAVQPTRGLDVGAAEKIYLMLEAQKKKGSAVLLISMDLDEVMYVSDRMGVMFEGKLVALFDSKDADRKRIGSLMTKGRPA